VKSEDIKATPSMVASDPSGSARAWAIVIGEGVGDGVGTGVGEGVGLGVAEGDGEGVSDGVGDDETDADGEGLALTLGIGVTDGDGEDVVLAVGEGVGGTMGGAAAFCGSGSARTTKSTTFEFVSWPDPFAPPGSRSRLELAAGAGAGAPSNQVLAAVPHPTASMAVLAP
jgi:hypothetical protein